MFIGDPDQAHLPSFNDTAWENVDVPAPLKLQPTDVGPNNLQCVAWYRRWIEVPSWVHGCLLLRFEAAMQVTDVWVDGIHLGAHYGGFTPFGWDVTEYLLPGRPAMLAVRLDNTDQPNVPPGKPQSKLDFDFFGGLYRDVWLTAASPVHISEPIVEGRVAGGGIVVTTTGVDSGSATVKVSADVINKGTRTASATVRTVVMDADGSVVAGEQEYHTVTVDSTVQFTSVVNIENPCLWSPDRPYLYTAHCEVYLTQGVVDHTSVRFGIRGTSWDKMTGFVLNGQQLLLTGTNRGHQEYPYVGYAAPASQQRRDAQLIKESGANFVRSAHYPPHPAFLDACDEFGLMVMNCIPGWQYWNSSQVFSDRSQEDLRTMIRRDRNHPSIIVWETTLNETYNGNTPFERDQVEIAQEEYGEDHACTYGGNGTVNAEMFDVQNAYWVRTRKEETPAPAPDAALFYREYGDYEFGGEGHNTSRTTRADGEQAMLNTVRNKRSELSQFLEPGFFGSGVLAGLATWSATDYNRGSEVRPCHSGLMDLFRVPKFVYYFYQSQREPYVHHPGVDSGPMLYIANWWAAPPSLYTMVSNNTTIDAGINCWEYVGRWRTTNDGDYVSDHAENMAVLKFNGNSVTLYGSLDNEKGVAAVALDSGETEYVDLYSANQKNNASIWVRTDLTDGPHTVSVMVTGQKNPMSTGTGVALNHAQVATDNVMPEPRRIVVFSNCDTVELRRNRELVATQTPDTGDEDANIAHPPFTFDNVDFEPGEIHATGFLGDKPVATQSVRTPQAADHVEVRVDMPKRALTADGVDFAVVRAMVVDSHGSVVPENGRAITFYVTGRGELIGDESIGANPRNATAGVSTALVRTSYEPGCIAVRATAQGLRGGQAHINTISDETPRL